MKRDGTTLIELSLIISLLGLMGGMAVPRVVQFSAMRRVNLAELDLIRALDATRAIAVRKGAPVQLTERGGQLVVVGASGMDSTTIWSGPHPASRGATMSGFGTPIAFGPDGLGWGVANRTIEVSSQQHHRRIVISRLGRIR